ncbi:MAG: hypothetical protein IK016_11775 [Lachnospiraceae bacterium]|nr:hypothetical protein [Lachnospiraceae bacterium]
MEHMLLPVLGVALMVIGMMNIRGNVNTVHSYHRRKVRKEDIPKYGKCVGTGTLIIGIALVLSFVVLSWNVIPMEYIFIPALVIGLAFILYGQIRYNHGLF